MSAQADPPPVEAFGNLPQAEFGRLSPDGKHLALVQPYEGHEKVAVYDLTKPGEAPYVIGMEGGLAGSPHWKGNDRLICVFHANLRRRGGGLGSWNRALSVTPSTRTAVLLMYNIPYFRSNHYTGVLADMDADDPDHVLMTALNRWDTKVTLDLYRVDVKTGIADLVLHGNTNLLEFLTNGRGAVLGRLEQDADLNDHVVLGEKDVLSYPVKGNAETEIDGVIGDSGPLAMRKATPAGTTGLYAWDPAGATPLFENTSFDLDDTIFDERTGRVTGVTYTDDHTRVKYFDPAMQRVQDALEKANPGQSVLILSKDDAGSTYLILTEGAGNPPMLSLYTPANQQTKSVQEAYPSLKKFDLGETRPYPYKARDGLDIHSYLTLPPGKAARNLPVVVFPHGGPEARDGMDFDWWAQFMASRGYAVLQPNYRGSSGYGWAFTKAGDGEWAGKAQDDLEDGVQKLIADRIADPRRICIVGASWGGTLALLGAAFKPDLYACAASFAGVSDLRYHLYSSSSWESEGVSIWKRRFGAETDSKKMDSQSAANYADRVKIPILLIHSEKDVTVGIKQSEIEESALKHAGKQVEFIRLEGDDHNLEYAETRIRMLRELERFLDAQIGDHRAAPTAASAATKS